MRVEKSRVKWSHQIHSLEASISESIDKECKMITSDALSVIRTIPHYIYVYDKEMLIACMNLFSPNSSEVEIQTLIHPSYDYAHIFARMVEEINAYKDLRLVHVANNAIPHAIETLDAMGYFRFHSELLLAKKIEHQEKSLHARLLTQENRLDFTQAFHDTFDVDKTIVEGLWTKFLSNDHISFSLYEDQGKTVGISGSNRYAKTAMIFGFGVLPKQRGKAYSKRLLATVEEELYQTGYEMMELEVDADNCIARNLYKTYGFSEKACYDYYLVIPQD